MKSFFIIVAFVAMIGAVIFGLNMVGFISYSFWAPKYEGVRRDVMIQSRAYSEATLREMYRFKLQYEQAQGEAERNTIRQFALHEAQSSDISRLPQDLQTWLKGIQ